VASAIRSARVVMTNVGAEKEAKRTCHMYVFYHFRAEAPFPERFHHVSIV
jgi:hypothetical protein